VSNAEARPDDLYPSRVGGTGGLLPRLDPVVAPHGEGPLETKALARFDRDGFLVVRGLLSRVRTEALLAAVEQHNDTRCDDPALVREPETGALRSIFRIHREPGPFAQLAHEPRLVAIAEQILGTRVYVHQSRVNRKPAFAGKEFYWHSDFETWHVEDGMPRMRALSASIALTPNHAWNAPLLLIPGSHRHYVACPGRTPANHYEQSLRRQEYGTPGPDALRWLVERGGIVQVTAEPGDAVLFDCNAMHGSNGNITPDPRTNVFLVYNSVENPLEPPFGGMPPRPEFLATRRVEPVAHDAAG